MCSLQMSLQRRKEFTQPSKLEHQWRQQTQPISARIERWILGIAMADPDNSEEGTDVCLEKIKGPTTRSFVMKT